MKLVYLDCPAGISGDMTLAALIAAGADIGYVRAAINAVAGIDAGLCVIPFADCGIHGLQLRLDLPHDHAHRTMKDIRKLIMDAGLEPVVSGRSLAVFQALATAEGHVHGKPADEVHFHEVGAMDSIIDIVGVAAALHSLGADKVTASPLPMTYGHVQTRHGLMPVPAPATIEVLKGYRVYGVEAEGEFVTPTGAAFCAALAGNGTPMPEMEIIATGYGFGMKTWPDGRPNCVRAIIGKTVDSVNSEWEISANIDDSSPDQVARLLEALMDAGALDAWICPIQMKKGRPAWQVSALTDAGSRKKLSELFFLESSTIGVRACKVERTKLERKSVVIATSLGDVTVKKAFLDGRTVNTSPESDDLRRIAAETGKTLKEVRSIVETEINNAPFFFCG